MNLLERLRRVFTPVKRLCKHHAKITKDRYYLQDEEFCFECLKKLKSIK